MKKKSLCWVVILSQVYTFLVKATDAFIEEEKEENIASRIIIYPSLSTTERGPKPRFIVGSSLNNISSMTIDVKQRKISFIRDGQASITLDQIFQPLLPWNMPYEKLLKFIQSHTFYLKELNQGCYKLDMYLCLLGGGNGSSTGGGGGSSSDGYRCDSRGNCSLHVTVHASSSYSNNRGSSYSYNYGTKGSGGGGESSYMEQIAQLHHT